MADWENAPTTKTNDGWEDAPSAPAHQGILHDLGQVGAGAASTILGAPGDVYDTLRSHLTTGTHFAKDIGKAPSLTSAGIGERLFGAPQNTEDVANRRAGSEMLMGLSPAKVGLAATGGNLRSAASSGIDLASEAKRFVGNVLPGATRRAEETIRELGPSLDKDAIGRATLSSLRPDYDALHAERGKLLQGVANSMEEGPEKTKAFRDIFQDPKFADLKKFEESPLGAKVVATTTKYSDVPKINPKNFIKQAFNSPQDVRDLRGLFNGDQTAVEKLATRYVASDLKSVMEGAKVASSVEANPFKSEAGVVAQGLERWRLKNADWLKEVPETKKTVDTFIDNMVTVASTQKHFKYAAAAAATLGMYEGGFHPFSWVGRLFGGVE